jgi:hypothetical protein
MKNLNKLGIILLVAVAAIFSSCSSDSSGGGGSAALGTVKAKVGSSNFTSISQGTFASLLDNGSFQNLSISGSDITGKSIQIMIIGANIAPGTYQISDVDSEFSATTVYSEIDLNTSSAQAWGSPYEGGGNSGSVVITSLTSTNVQGTFNFTGKSEAGTTKSITNGSFNVNLTSN